MKRLIPFLALSTLIILANCPENPVDSSQHAAVTNSDSIASSYFQAIGDTLQSLSTMNLDAIKNVRFDGIRNGFNTVLQSDPANGIAHLGLAVLEILELNYDTDIWALVDSIADWSAMGPTPVNHHRALLGRQFELMVEVPIALELRRTLAFPDNVTLGNIQSVVENKVLPALSRSIGHLTSAEGYTDTWLRILADAGLGEYVVVDLGEIYIFDATVHALQAVFNMMVARDIDLFGPDGTYGYIDDIRHLDDSTSCAMGTITPGTRDALELRYYGGTQAQVDSIVIAVLYHNMANRLAFLGLRQGGLPHANARNAFVATADKLTAAADFIRNVRQNETEENLVKLADLTGLDSDLPPNGGPNFAQNFNKIEDVLTFVKSLLSGPVQFSEKLGGNQTPFQFALNLNAWFSSPVANLKSLLPYYRWALPAGAWLQCSTYFYQYDNGGNFWYGYADLGTGCQWQNLPNIGLVSSYDIYCSGPDILDFIELLDAPGGQPLDMDVAKFPYFPDYTLGGLFPDMTRTRWMTALGIQ